MDKGLPASMLMSNLQASLRILGPQATEIEFLAERLNSFFMHNLNLIRFISMFMTAIDMEAKTLKYTNAGHHPRFGYRPKIDQFNGFARQDLHLD